MLKPMITAAALTSMMVIASGCSVNTNTDEQQQTEQHTKEKETENNKPAEKENGKNESSPQVAIDTSVTPAQKGLKTLAEPESIPVLVNKEYSLPEDYTPPDLVYPNVPFIFEGKMEKMLMREEAARALEKMFEAAEKDGMPLSGVSAYRSHERQKAIFENYVQKDGYEKARTYSALPGTSEHETGLAIDVSSRSGVCPAQECFDETPESAWLADNAYKYGFIIRYPKGKEDITGYKYEAWHIRYVGKDVASEIYKEGSTLEEYYNALPVQAKSE
ncbi:M15 family metallopeptidase [Bacillus massiliglaciei]|uniref:M15 family metallopeptidase n=1 Tax=Bacillus massiliglaciei TaxID=1816693 RepID=UPI000A8BEF78|nr:M15 family metallopeptidase [Bacillus massiliglaciei]